VQFGQPLRCPGQPVELQLLRWQPNQLAAIGFLLLFRLHRELLERDRLGINRAELAAGTIEALVTGLTKMIPTREVECLVGPED
jgi:hypothetical protein